MNRKRITLITALLVLVTTGAFAQVVLQQPAAVVNLTEPRQITIDELNAKYEDYTAAREAAGVDTSSITRERVLNIMINDILVLQGASRDGVTLSETDLDTLVKRQKDSVSSQVGRQLDDAQFEQILTSYYGLTIEEYRKRIFEDYIVNAYVQKAKADVIASAKVPTEAEISSFFKKNAATFINPEYVKLAHIYINKVGRTDAEAKALADRIDRNIRYGVKGFDEQVIEYSNDEQSKFIGGVIGWLAIDDDARKAALGEAFFDAAFSLESGEVSRVVASPSGYHIIKVLEHRMPRLLSLDDTLTPGSVMTVRQYISQQMYQANKDAAYNAAVSALVTDLRGQAEITILIDEAQ